MGRAQRVFNIDLADAIYVFNTLNNSKNELIFVFIIEKI